jgi:hypothetical protein
LQADKYSFGWSKQKKKKKLSNIAAKLKDKRISITMVRVQFLSFATFPIPLISHRSLPESKFSKVGSLQISSSNPQNLQTDKFVRFGNLPQMWQFFQICDWQAQYYLRFTNLGFANSIFLQTKTSANPQIQPISEST